MSFKKVGLWPCAPNTTRGQVTKLSTSGSKLVYPNGRTVIIRDIEDPAVSISYSGHIQPTTVARFSPSGYYCASGDTLGNVRIWDTVGEENILKAEYPVLGGRINDLSWDGESKRIISAGDGKEKYAHAFMMESGSSCGEIIGHNKPINGVAIRHLRPFKAATASDDRNIVFHSGVPFKYEKTISTHSSFVLSLAYSPSGDHFVSSGADFKVFVYDGKSGETSFELPAPHKGSVTSVVWSPDNKSLLTSSTDCTVKLWDVETQKLTTSWTLGSGISHQQVGNAWLGSSKGSPDASLVSLSMSGDINVFDKRTSDRPVKLLHGLQKAATSSALTSSGTLIAGSADGRIVGFSDGLSTPLSGDTSTAYVNGLASTTNSVWSIGYDDRVREITSSGKEFTISSGTATTSQPKGVAAIGDRVIVSESNAIEIFEAGSKISSIPLTYEATSIAVSPSGEVAVGGQDNKIRLYDPTVKQEKGVLDSNRAAITALAFSPDSKLIAAGDSSGKIILYDVAEKSMITGRWAFHSAKINSLAWTADSAHVASASLDTDVYIWSVAKPHKKISIKNAIPGGANTVQWLKSGDGMGVVAAAGADPTFKVWEVTFP